MRGIAHPPQVVAAALAQLLTGSSLHAVARSTGLDRKTLRAWRRALGDLPPVPPPKTARVPARMPTDPRLARLADPKYLSTLGARELAQIHMGTFDMMERAGRAYARGKAGNR